MNRIPDPDDRFESTLTEALTSRSRHVRPGAGSIADVRTRARRRTRRRAVTGAGAVALLGGVGAVAAVARHHDTATTYRLLSGDDAAAPISSEPGDVTIWRCTGMLSAPSTLPDPTMDTIVPTSLLLGSNVPMTTAPFPVDATTTILLESRDTATTFEVAVDPAGVASSTTAPVAPPGTDLLVLPTLVEPALASTTVVEPAVATTVMPATADSGGYRMIGCTPETSNGR